MALQVQVWEMSIVYGIRYHYAIPETLKWIFSMYERSGEDVSKAEKLFDLRKLRKITKTLKFHRIIA